MGVLKVKVAGQWVDVGTSTVALDPGRNLLDNGQFAVKQRSSTGFGLGAAGAYLADRWSVTNNGIGAINVAHVAISAGNMVTGRPRPGNWQYFAVATAEAAAAVAAADYFQMAQSIEGLFLQHLNWGTADAQPLTLSFDIYSNVAANYVVELYRQETPQRTISRLVSVPVGWSTQTVTFPGDVTTAITNDNTGRLVLVFAFGGGSNFTSGTLQTSWGAVVNANRWVGLTNNFAATINNQVIVTNIQMEVGSQATPYAVRDYAQELQKCMRYFRRTDTGLHGEGGWYGVATAASQQFLQNIPFPVPMRATPTVTSRGTFANTGLVSSVTYGANPSAYYSLITTNAAGNFAYYSNNSGYLEFSAEI